MKKQTLGPLEFVLILLLGLLLCFFVVGFVPKTIWAEMVPKVSQDYAAWVQAFGSIAAIGGAFAIVWVQIRHANRMDEERRLLDLKLRFGPVLAIVDQAFMEIRVDSMWANEIDRSPSTKFGTRSDRHLSLNDALSELDAIEVTSLPSWIVAENFMSFRYNFKILCELNKQARQQERAGYGLDSLKEVRDSVLRVMENTREFVHIIHDAAQGSGVFHMDDFVVQKAIERQERRASK